MKQLLKHGMYVHDEVCTDVRGICGFLVKDQQFSGCLESVEWLKWHKYHPHLSVTSCITCTKGFIRPIRVLFLMYECMNYYFGTKKNLGSLLSHHWTWRWPNSYLYPTVKIVSSIPFVTQLIIHSTDPTIYGYKFLGINLPIPVFHSTIPIHWSQFPNSPCFQ